MVWPAFLNTRFVKSNLLLKQLMIFDLIWFENGKVNIVCPNINFSINVTNIIFLEEMAASNKAARRYGRKLPSCMLLLPHDGLSHRRTSGRNTNAYSKNPKCMLGFKPWLTVWKARFYSSG